MQTFPDSLGRTWIKASLTRTICLLDPLELKLLPAINANF